jgi:hypothetical protein
MRRKNKIIFETKEDMEILKAVVIFIGKTSLAGRQDDGLTEKESKLCSKLYELLSDLDDN